MKGLIKQLKYRFYRQSITKRIILVITMLEKELEMFFNGNRNDAVSVLLSDSCQTLLSDSEEFLSSDTAIQYRKYKLMQGTIMSTIGQREMPGSIS